MKKHSSNPATNELPASISDGGVSDAIVKSGYPLQLRVAKLLADRFQVQHEWSYNDPTSGKIRTLDLLAEKYLYDRKEQPRVRPILDLLVECKKSGSPYVFFQAEGNVYVPGMPRWTGLFNNTTVTVTTDDDPSSWSTPIRKVLGLEEEGFLNSPHAMSATFAKFNPKGEKGELSGDDLYNGLMMPLEAATDHFIKVETPPKTAQWFDLHLVLPIAVIDAPMIASSLEGDKTSLELTPWVRVYRHSTNSSDESFDRSKVYAVDVVHVDFLGTYIDEHLLPFAETFSQRTIKHASVLASGKGFVSGMGKRISRNLEPDLRPQQIGDTSKRITAVAKKVVKKRKD